MTLFTSELNEAIYQVITNRKKSDAREAHKVVKEAGYTIYKYDYCYGVHSEKTGRTIYVSGLKRGYADYLVCSCWTDYKKLTSLRNDAKIDYTGILDAEINADYRYVVGYQNRRETIEKYDELKWVKDSLEWRKADIERTQKKIAALQEELVRNIEYKCKKEREIEDVRRKLGLRR